MGSTFVKADNFEFYEGLKYEDISSLPQVKMDFLHTGCFLRISNWHATGHSYMMEELFGCSYVITLVQQEAIEYLLDNLQVFDSEDFKEYYDIILDDISSLKNFIKENGSACVWEICSI